MFLTYAAVLAVIVASLAKCGNGEAKDTATGGKSNTFDFSYCGENRQPVSRSRVRRVIGGQDAQAHQWPWTVLIMNQSDIYCGGSVISPTFIITAAHCVDNISQSLLNFYVGKHKADVKDPHEQKLTAQKVYIHSKYRRGSSTHPGDYDMALVEMKNRIRFTEQVRPICLTDVNTFQPGHECVLSGWGYTNAKKPSVSNTLQQIRLPLVSRKVCNSNKSYGGKIPERYLCAGVPEGGKDGCRYDSGGPLMCAHSDTDPWYLVGMMAWGAGCAEKYKYGVYTNVAQVMTMVRNTVKDLPQPYLPATRVSPTPAQTSKNKTEDRQKEKIFIAIIAALSVIIIILLTTLCIVNFYTRGYICCTSMEHSKHHKEPKILHEQNGKLNREVSV
ncbi:coagulation factor IX-like [Dendronephthya gigantea]|uniref:coagulation factor IX-like n=1 Tax=Dendronephthya gigantea TaxID=151771 RepID=UPI00106D1203|nr:coagulation factor IX-like [Dendronephthya gigantea]XP_028394295.1 coagulation factor IX-like [Dendronephthya gigantea]XP_028394297.1 coagulation factor IX-like [Dendronephthya gigantea]